MGSKLPGRAAEQSADMGTARFVKRLRALRATGCMLRFAKDKDRPGLFTFLEKQAATMPRETLRAAIEPFDKKQRNHYLSRKLAGRTNRSRYLA